MTIQGAMNELVNLLKADDIPIYYKGGIKKVIETIDDYIDGEDDYVKRKTENSSEIPNNCEHITEDGVTCAKYPACDDCLDNPLNKVKGSERLVKGSEQTDCPWK